MLKREAINVGISSLNVWIDCAQAGLREWLRYPTPSQRTRGARLDGNWRRSIGTRMFCRVASLGYASASRDERDHSVIRRVLDDVESNISKVALVGDCVTS